MLLLSTTVITVTIRRASEKGVKRRFEVSLCLNYISLRLKDISLQLKELSLYSKDISSHSNITILTVEGNIAPPRSAAFASLPRKTEVALRNPTPTARRERNESRSLKVARHATARCASHPSKRVPRPYCAVDPPARRRPSRGLPRGQLGQCPSAAIVY